MTVPNRSMLQNTNIFKSQWHETEKTSESHERTRANEPQRSLFSHRNISLVQYFLYNPVKGNFRHLSLKYNNLLQDIEPGVAAAES